MRSALILLAIFLSPAMGFSAITIVDVSGASNYLATGSISGGTAVTSPTVFGGTAGAPTCAFDNSDGTCSNCSSTVMPSFGYVCNERRVLPGRTLRIGIKSTTVAGYPALYNNTTGNRITNITSPLTPANATGYLETTWSNLCNNITSPEASCDTASNTVFTIGIDKANNATKDSDDDITQITIVVNNKAGTVDFGSGPVFINNTTGAPGGDALYQIAVQAGDEKAYLLQPFYGSNFPNGAVANWVKYRLYFSTAAIIAATPIESLGVAEFDVSRSGTEIEISPNLVDGLTNGTPYFFVGAHVDQANNIGYFSDDTVTLTATPDFVYGLLSKDFECFVATATYGTPDVREVLTLRQFRNYLIQHHDRWARPFIRLYYKYSPQLSNYIRDNEFLKTISRAVLWAPIQFAKLSLHRGMGYALFVFWAPVFFLLGLIFWLQGRRHAKLTARR